MVSPNHNQGPLFVADGFHSFLGFGGLPLLFIFVSRYQQTGERRGNETIGSKIIFIKRGGQLMMGENDSPQVFPPRPDSILLASCCICTVI